MDFVLTKILQTDWPFVKELHMNSDVMRFISDLMPENNYVIGSKTFDDYIYTLTR